MHTYAQHLEFAPPPPRGTGRSVFAALIVHALLLVALTAGIEWKQDNSLVVEAELWSALPRATQPERELTPPPPPPEEAQTSPEVSPPPPPVNTAAQHDAEIALEKKRKLEEEKNREAQRMKEKREEERKKAEEKKAKLKAEEDKRKLEAKQEDARKEKERKDKEAKKLQQQKDQQASLEEAKKLETIRKENMKRLAGLAGATPDDAGTGHALKSAGPSESYAGRIRARIKPNITFADDVLGNPAAEVEVRCAPDGTIVSRKLLKSSGNPAWDNAVLKAVDKTEVLPRDIDGRVHSPLIISFRPKD